MDLNDPIYQTSLPASDGRRNRPRRHPYKSMAKADGSGISIHRYRAEKALGKPLPRTARVHHADGSYDEHAPLVICQDEKYHRLLHARMRVRDAGGNPNTDNVCRTCAQVKPRTEFSPNKSAALGCSFICKSCASEWQRAHRRKAA